MNQIDPLSPGEAVVHSLVVICCSQLSPHIYILFTILAYEIVCADVICEFHCLYCFVMLVLLYSPADSMVSWVVR